MSNDDAEKKTPITAADVQRLLDKQFEELDAGPDRLIEHINSQLEEIGIIDFKDIEARLHLIESRLTQLEYDRDHAITRLMELESASKLTKPRADSTTD